MPSMLGALRICLKMVMETSLLIGKCDSALILRLHLPNPLPVRDRVTTSLYQRATTRLIEIMDNFPTLGLGSRFTVISLPGNLHTFL